MVDQDDRPLEARPPSLEDLVVLCRRLNEEGARYIVIGGMAMIRAGFVRGTEDIDLLVDVAPENVARLRRALMALPDQAVRDMADADLQRYAVVRIADEFVVDLMRSACGVDYEEGRRSIDWVTVDGVPIPFATPELLWRTKQTLRERDREDVRFLAALLERSEGS